MSVRNRAFFALFGMIFASTVGCGGHSSVPHVKVTATPTASPTPNGPPTPTPTAAVTATPYSTPAALGLPPTPTPLAPNSQALAVPSRPIDSGDAFAFAGTTTQSYVYRNVTPPPTSSTTYAVTQNVSVTGPTSYAGQSGVSDFKTVEVDSQPNQTITVTTYTYYGTAAYQSSTGFYTYGYTSADTNGQQLAVTYPAPLLLDVLPEAAGATWTNGAAETLTQTESDGFSAQRTVNADGSYSENDTYPQTSQFSSPPPLTATLTANADGSASYSLPLLGLTPNSTITYSAPQSGTISVSVSDSNTSNPPIQTASVAAWFATPLYTESDIDDGEQSVPAACDASAIATQADAIDQRIQRTDAIAGTHDWFDEVTYVAPSVGPVCVVLYDVTYAYYDLSGQGNEEPYGLTISGGLSPLQVDTLSSTLGLTGDTVQATARRPEAIAQATLRAASARSSFLAILERRRADRLRLVGQRLRALVLERTGR